MWCAGDIIASFLDENVIDEFVIGVAPVFIGEGIPLLARRPRHVRLKLLSSERFEDGLVQSRTVLADAIQHRLGPPFCLWMANFPR